VSGDLINETLIYKMENRPVIRIFSNLLMERIFRQRFESGNVWKTKQSGNITEFFMVKN